MPYSKHESAADFAFDRQVFFGATALAFVAGYVNTVMLDVYHVPVSHMSGAVSRLGIDIGEGRYGELKILLSIVTAFFCGAAISGYVIGSNNLKPGRRYGVILFLEGVILMGVSGFGGGGGRYSVPLAALACGLQNAMASSYYGLIIRTTHMTGILTDLGFLLGSVFRHGKRIGSWKFALLLLILLGFFSGGLAAVFAKLKFGTSSILVMGASLVVAGLVYVARHARAERSG